MKTMKRIMALVIALIMSFALAIPASAAPGTIKITNAASGATYSFYRVFDMKDDNASYYIYTTNAKWDDFVKAGGNGAGYVTVLSDNTVQADSLGNEADAKAFAALVVAEGIDADKEVVAASSGELTITGMALGYYVVKSSRGGLFTVNTLNHSGTPLEITEKNDVLPQFSKTVEEDKDSTYGDSNTAEINQEITFKLQIIADAGTDTYSIEDTLTNMEFGGVDRVTLNGTLVNASNYTVTPAFGGSTFKIVFGDTFREGLKDNDDINVFYTATLTEAAIIAGSGNNNTATFTHDSTATIEDSTISYTYNLIVNKTDGTNPLSGAGFTLYREDDSLDDSLVYVVKDGLNYIVTDSLTPGAKTEIMTDASGSFTINGLDTDSYTLVETTIPSGYYKVDDKTITITGSNDEVGIVNTRGTVLPETGGIGTPVFYGIGGLLVVAALALLTIRKRSAAK